MALAMSPAGCCKQPLFEMDAKSAHEVSEAPDVPLGMQPEDDGLLLDGQIASPNDDPDLMRALWRVQEQQLSSLDALRKLRSQHQEWQRTIQDMVRQVTVQLPRKGSEFSVKSSGQPDAPTATSPKLSNAADEASEATDVVSVELVEEKVVSAPSLKTATDAQDPMKTQETENVIQTPEEPSRHQMLSPWQVLFNQNKPKTVKMSTTNKLKRFDDYSLFPSDWQRWIDHLVEKAQEKPEFDGSVWTACRVYAYRVVSRRSFEHFVGFLIALNLILQGAETEMDLRDPDGLTRSFFAMVDMAFNVVYCLEIFLRFVAGGLGVLCDTWFLADTVLVLLGVSASIFSVSGGTSARQFIVVRGLRLLRLGRAIRMTKKFKVMWHLVNGLLNSLQLMISVFMLLILSIYIFACLGVELITKDESLHEDVQTKAIVDEYFSSLPLTMLTLIQFITLDSIGSIYFPIVRSKPRLILFFLPILMILPITLMNLVTAVLVEHGLENAQAETAEDNRNRARYIKKSVIELGELFEELDRDRNGLITPFELNMVPPDHVPKELLDVLFVDDLADIFMQLDVDGTGELSKDEFVNGILQMITRDTPMETLQIMKILQSLRTKVATLGEQVAELCKQEDLEVKMAL